MEPPFNPAPARSPAFPDNQRRHGRVICDGVESSLGSVLDVSASGMRVKLSRRVQWREGQMFDMSLLLGSEIVPVKVRVVRVTRRRFRSSEAGLEFCDPSPSVRSALAALACVGSSKRAHEEIDVRLDRMVA